VDRRRIQRLSAAALDADQFRELAAHGEDLLVERKVQIPTPERLGAETASMANVLGGWIFLGVDDKSRELRPLDLPAGIDMQSHIGNLLRKSVDPVPPFLADQLEVDGMTVGFVRVFQAAVPILCTGNGSVYVRDDGGKRPIDNHRMLLELARRGEEAEESARERPNRNALTLGLLGLDKQNAVAGQLQAIVRAAPLTVTPQMAEWPVSAGPGTCLQVAQCLGSSAGADAGFEVQVRPFGRATAAHGTAAMQLGTGSISVMAIADCAGIFAASLSLPVVNFLATHELRRTYIRPVINAVALLLQGAEAYGDAVVDLHLVLGREVSLDGGAGVGSHPIPPRVHCGSAILGTPADEEDLAALGRRWEREISREAGIAMFETDERSG
jgi:hypothetical protein